MLDSMAHYSVIQHITIKYRHQHTTLYNIITSLALKCYIDAAVYCLQYTPYAVTVCRKVS